MSKSFLEELRVNLQEIEENMLYEEIEENQDGIVNDIFSLFIKRRNPYGKRTCKNFRATQ